MSSYQAGDWPRRNVLSLEAVKWQKQGHHHNGNQAAQRLHILCSISRSAFITHLGFWRKLYGSSWHHFIYPANIFLYLLIDIFIDIQPFGCNLKWLVTTALRASGRVGSGLLQFDTSPMCSYYLPTDTWFISDRFWVIYLAPKALFASVRLGYDDNYRPRSHCFVERHKNGLR